MVAASVLLVALTALAVRAHDDNNGAPPTSLDLSSRLGSSSSCADELRASCPLHQQRDRKACDICCGRHQHVLRTAACAAADCEVYCSSTTSHTVAITDADLTASRFPFGLDFFGTTPDPDKAGLNCGIDASVGSNCFYKVDDRWLKETLPVWQPPTGAVGTRPWVNGFSMPRLLGGIATHNATTNTYTPNLDFEVVTRSASGTLVTNWTRIDVTIDGWLHAAKTEHFLLVLDNVPYCFVKPENRYYLSFGMVSPRSSSSSSSSSWLLLLLPLLT
jgi:hypothetical protein